MAITAASTQDEKFNWLTSPFHTAATYCTLNIVVLIGLATDPVVSKTTCCVVAIIALVGNICMIYRGVFRMSRAAGKL